MKFGKEKNQNILASNIEYFFNILIMKSLFHECLYFFRNVRWSNQNFKSIEKQFKVFKIYLYIQINVNLHENCFFLQIYTINDNICTKRSTQSYRYKQHSTY